MKNLGYRSFARDALARAKAEVASCDPERLKYAALDLRMTIEALVYDRLHLFRDELTGADYDTWQPKKIMAMLLDIDPWADEGGSLAVGLEDGPNHQATAITPVGCEYVLSMATIKKHYDALGSNLHLPTVKQFHEGRQRDLKGLRQRLEQIIVAIEPIFTSSHGLYNLAVTPIVEFQCQRCGEIIRKRAPQKKSTRAAPCLGCGAEYRLTDGEDNKVSIASLTTKVDCINAECGKPMELWNDEIKEGYTWKCKECRHEYRIGLQLQKTEESKTPSPAS